MDAFSRSGRGFPDRLRDSVSVSLGILNLAKAISKLHTHSRPMNMGWLVANPDHVGDANRSTCAEKASSHAAHPRREIGAHMNNVYGCIRVPSALLLVLQGLHIVAYALMDEVSTFFRELAINLTG